jgi:hypothetical protein
MLLGTRRDADLVRREFAQRPASSAGIPPALLDRP